MDFANTIFQSFSIEDLFSYIRSLSPISLFLFFTVSNVIENVFPPWPGDTVTVFGGFLAGNSEQTGFPVLVLVMATYLGNIIGALLMYFFGEKFLNFLQRFSSIPFFREMLNPKSLHKTFHWFEKYSFWILVFSRFSAGIRFFVAIVSGMLKLPISIFLLGYSLGTILWSGMLVFGGYSLGKNFQVVLEYLALYNRIIFGIMVLGAIVYVFYRFFLRRQKKRKMEV